MKLFLSIMCTFALTMSSLNAKPNDNMTDIEEPKSYAKEMLHVQTADAQCNYYSDIAGLNLWNMAEAEDRQDSEMVSLEYSKFKYNAKLAIDNCKYVDENLTQEMILIVEGVNHYYKYQFIKIKK